MSTPQTSAPPRPVNVLALQRRLLAHPEVMRLTWHVLAHKQRHVELVLRGGTAVYAFGETEALAIDKVHRLFGELLGERAKRKRKRAEEAESLLADLNEEPSAPAPIVTRKRS